MILAFSQNIKLCGLNLVQFCPNVGTDPVVFFGAVSFAGYGFEGVQQ